MSSFIPLNLAEDPTLSKKESEEEHSRELQVEQSFKLFQEALNLHKEQKFVESYAVYDELFKLDVISNHYHEEPDFIRGLQNGATNSVPDELAYLSPNVKTLRYLVFRNRGFLYLDILKDNLLVTHISLIESKSEDSDHSGGYDEKFKNLFYTLVDDLCVSLFYQDGDEFLLQALYEIFTYIGIQRLAKSTLEYSISREGDDLIPIDRAIYKKLNLLNGKLKIIELSSKQEQSVSKSEARIDKKWDFLKVIKSDYQTHVLKSKSLSKVEVRIDKELTWLSIIESLNHTLKKKQDSNKVQNVLRQKIKYFEPYLLTEEPIERINFVIPEKSDRPAEPVDVPVEVTVEEPVEIEQEVAELQEEELDQTESAKQQIVQRSSKRLARTDVEISVVELKQEFFFETTRFFDNLNSYLDLIGNKLKLSDPAKVFVEHEPSKLPSSDFVSLLNNWSSAYTKCLYSSDSKISTETTDGAKLKLIEVLNNFNKKGKSSNFDKIPFLSESRGVLVEYLSQLNDQNLHYEDVKISIIQKLIGILDGCCLLVDTRWDERLFFGIRDWVLQFDTFLLEAMKMSNEDNQSFDHLALAVSVQEIMVDTYISVKNQINSILQTTVKKTSHTRSSINNLTLELLRIHDKLRRWSSLYDDTFHELTKDKFPADEAFFKIHCRYSWCMLQKEKIQNSNMENNELLMIKLYELLSYAKESGHMLEISLPNYENLVEINLDSIKAQLTSTSVMAMFSKIIYTDCLENHSDAIQLLEAILIKTEHQRNKLSPEEFDHEAIDSIKSFLDTSPIDMKLSLWSVLFSYYDGAKAFDQLQFGFGNFMDYAQGYLVSANYLQAQEVQRKHGLMKMIGALGESLHVFLTNAALNSWSLPELSLERLSTTLSKLLFFCELLYLFSLHEEAAMITILKVSIKGRSKGSYEKLKEICVSVICAIILYYKAIVEKTQLSCMKRLPTGTQSKALTNTLALGEDFGISGPAEKATVGSTEDSEQPKSADQITCDLVSLVHEQLGLRRLCANSEFLKMAQDFLATSEIVRDKDISQIISCRYHYDISIGTFNPKDHETDSKAELDRGLTLELAKFVFPLCFKQNPMVHIPKHGLKSLLDEFYEVIGDPNFESSNVLTRNSASFEYFLDTTTITPRLIRDSFHGLLKLDFEFPTKDLKIVQDGLYYLQGLLVFTSYKVKKKNMQSRIVELEHIIMLLKNDLIFSTNRMESWFLLGQAFGFLVEDDLIWTADKLTVPERKIGTANLQRKSLLCYLMAINEVHSELRFKPIIGNLMSKFAKEMYSACMEPMNMHAFEALAQPKFINSSTGSTTFVSVVKSQVSKDLSFKIIQQSLHLAIKADPSNWINYYYLAKVQKKLGKSSYLILETLQTSATLAMEKSSGNAEHIIEPHYIICSMVYKYVKKDILTIEEGMKYLRDDPVIQCEDQAETKEEFFKAIVSSLRQIDAYDKKNWHHKPGYRLAKVLFDEFGDVVGALEEMNHFISLKVTSKSLISIWKPEHERPGKHFYYTYQYCKFFIQLLTKNLDLISLISMLPKLKRSNSIMINLYNVWENICQSICKITRSSLEYDEDDSVVSTLNGTANGQINPVISNGTSSVNSANSGEYNFKFSEKFIQVIPFQTFTIEFKELLKRLESEGIPKALEIYFYFLYALNDIKKANNGFGPTSLIDDTLVCTFLRIYLYYSPDIINESTVSNGINDSPGSTIGKVKKIAKRDIFPFVLDILRTSKKGLDSIIADDPDICNKFVRQKDHERNGTVTVYEVAKVEEIPKSDEAADAEAAVDQVERSNGDAETVQGAVRDANEGVDIGSEMSQAAKAPPSNETEPEGEEAKKLQDIKTSPIASSIDVEMDTGDVKGNSSDDPVVILTSPLNEEVPESDVEEKDSSSTQDGSTNLEVGVKRASEESSVTNNEDSLNKRRKVEEPDDEGYVTASEDSKTASGVESASELKDEDSIEEILEKSETNEVEEVGEEEQAEGATGDNEFSESEALDDDPKSSTPKDITPKSDKSRDSTESPPDKEPGIPEEETSAVLDDDAEDEVADSDLDVTLVE